MPRTLIVANPISGRGRGGDAAERLAALLRPSREIEVYFTARAGDARRRAAHIDEFDDVVVVGGDGTINEVVTGLSRFDRPIGVLPVGTANLLGTSLGLSGDPEQTAALMSSAEPTPFDIGEMGDRRFFAVAGIGFDAAVVRGVEARRRGPITKWSYVWPTIVELARHQPRRLRVIVDGEVVAEDGAWVLVCNVPHYAAYFRFAPHASPRDGRLDVVVLRRRSRWSIVDLHRRALRGRTARSGVIYTAGSEVRVECDEDPIPFQLDGDLVGDTPVTLRLRPGLLRFFAAEGAVP